MNQEELEALASKRPVAKRASIPGLTDTKREPEAETSSQPIPGYGALAEVIAGPPPKKATAESPAPESKAGD